MILVRALRALLASVVLSALLAGPPYALYHFRGWPLPAFDEIAAALLRPDDGTLLLGFLTLIGWGAWATFAIAVVREVAARIRGQQLAPRTRGLGWMQWFAAGLIAAITFAASSPAMSASIPPPVVATAPLHPLVPKTATAQRELPIRTYAVKPGDTLSAIADRKLGGARKWTKIWKLNAFERQDDGRVFRDPDLIHPGWKLQLPMKPAPKHIVTPPPAETNPLTPMPTWTARSAVPTPPPRAEGTSSRVVVVVEVPDGGVVGMAFAAGISTAWAASKLWRRKRHRAPAVGEPIKLTPEPQPEPAVEAVWQAYAEQGESPPDDFDLVRESLSTEIPAELVVGRRSDHRQVALQLAGLNLGLAGPGGKDVVRALCVELLRQSDHYRAELIIALHEAADLFGIPADELQQFDESGALPGLTLTGTPEDALARLEELYLTRGRIMFERDADDIADLRIADPGDVLPAVLLVTSLQDRPNRRLESLVRVAVPYGIGALLLGRWSAGTSCQVDTGGRVTGAEGEQSAQLADALLFHATRSQTSQFVRVIATAHGAVEPGIEAETEPEPVRLAPVIREQEAEPAPPVSLLLLGPPEVWAGEKLIPLARREKAFELFVYLALHPGTTRKQLLKVLWPGGFPGDFHSTLRHLRDPLKQATGLTGERFVHHTSDHYRIAPEAVGVDLWQFQEILARVRVAEDDGSRIAELEKVAGLCRGPALDGAEFPWRDREGWPITRAVADALTQLAELHRRTDPDRAIEILGQCLTLDPDCEEGYRNIVSLQWHVGRRAEARRTVQTLKQRLAVLGARPEEETTVLFARVLGGPERRMP